MWCSEFRPVVRGLRISDQRFQSSPVYVYIVSTVLRINVEGNYCAVCLLAAGEMLSVVIINDLQCAKPYLYVSAVSCFREALLVVWRAGQLICRTM